MIKFCHIAPTNQLLRAAALSERHMALHHLVEEDEGGYVEKFSTISSEGEYIYLDNSEFELGAPCSLEELLVSGAKINANCLILPDGDISDESINIVKASGYDVMVIPAGENFKEDFLAAIQNIRINYVGLSYSKTSEYYKRPRHSATSRFDFLCEVEEHLHSKKLHLLGAVTAGEIALMKPFEWAIESWDSSIAVWGGLTNLDISNQCQKNPISVDFNSDLSWNLLCTSNIDYTKTLQKL